MVIGGAALLYYGMDKASDHRESQDELKRLVNPDDQEEYERFVVMQMIGAFILIMGIFFTIVGLLISKEGKHVVNTNR